MTFVAAGNLNCGHNLGSLSCRGTNGLELPASLLGRGGGGDCGAIQPQDEAGKQLN